MKDLQQKVQELEANLNKLLNPAPSKCKFLSRVNRKIKRHGSVECGVCRKNIRSGKRLEHDERLEAAMAKGWSHFNSMKCALLPLPIPLYNLWSNQVMHYFVIRKSHPRKAPEKVK